MEILKQAQYNPYPVEEQVISFFMVINGLLDSIDLAEVRRFEGELLTDLRDNTEILKEILEKKALDKELEAKIIKLVEDFKKNFS